MSLEEVEGTVEKREFNNGISVSFPLIHDINVKREQHQKYLMFKNINFIAKLMNEI